MFRIETYTREEHPLFIKEYELKYIKAQCDIMKLALEPIVAKQEYFLKSGYSAVDIMMAAVIPGAREFLCPVGSALEAYLNRMMMKPKAIKVKVFE